MLPELLRFDKWLRRKNPHSTTHTHYANDLALFFRWCNRTPAEVDLRLVDAFVEHCQQCGHASATINRRLAALRSFYHFLAWECDPAPANPVLPKRHFIRLGRHLPRDIQDAQVERLFAAITAPRDRAMFLLMLRCGLRVGEVRNLSLGDLFLQPAPGNLPRLWVRGKNGAERVVYLSAQAISALQAWLHIRPLVADQAVFLNRFGRRLSVTAIQLRLAAYCQQADLWVTCHQLRHTFGRQLVEAHVPVTSIQRLLGHARLRTTELYMHVSDQQVQADYEAAMAQITPRLLPEGGAQ